MIRRLYPALIVLLVFCLPAMARVISYAPYTDRVAFPAVQHRMNRHFVLVESRPGSGFTSSQLVIYDSKGEKAPSVIYPQDDSNVSIGAAAVRENAAGVPSILIQTTHAGALRFMFSSDAGATWKVLPVESFNITHVMSSTDVGGPFAGGRGSAIRIGTEADPFIITSQQAVFAISAGGTARNVLAVANPRLIGTDREGRRVLVQSGTEVLTLDTVTSSISNKFAVAGTNLAEGWITPSGSAYVHEWTGASNTLWLVNGGTRTAVMEAPSQVYLGLFAVPTFDHTGAWLIRRGPGSPTILYQHGSAGLVKHWEDITAPEVEALHAGSSGTRLLVQVHIPRRLPNQILFIDPALAIWNAGEPAPREYDELFLNEERNKGFVHLDVEKVALGEPFVFDSGLRWAGGGGGVSAGGGGGDVVQEWGVVRGSLKQKLILPSVGRTPGAFGSYWRTDVIFYNPYDEAQTVEIRFIPEGDTAAANVSVRAMTLAPREIRLAPDALLTIFGHDSGLGAFFIVPAKSVSVTSRTYSQSQTTPGTFGFGMNAIDMYAAAASPRFPVSFAGAFLGRDFRTNLVITDTSGAGTSTALNAAGLSGPAGFTDVMFTTSAGGQLRVNGVGAHMGLLPFDTGALLIRPVAGHAIASVFVTDNRTNDATYFPPDLPAPIARTIPAIGHLDGANDSHFRSDLYLYNPSPQARFVTIQAQMWDSPQLLNLPMTLLPNEARVIRDVLKTAFNRTGIAKLRYQSTGDSNGVRITSRTYSVDGNGGTYGFLMPPLNNFQMGTAGDTLEILGAIADPRYRTNIGLVEVTPWGGTGPANVRVQIVDSSGRPVDEFTASVPMSGGMQLNDIFRARAINVSGPVLIRVSPLSGVIGAYGAFVDNTTNDSLYLGANLGASR